MRGFERDVAGIGALAEPVRRQLYLFVCAQPTPVSRDQAADAVGVPRHKAKFHLDRLESEGLLETEYARVTGRTGPGAGRTAKLYRRAAREVAVSLPTREYELAGRLMAGAIAESARTGTSVLEILHRMASEYGTLVGGTALATEGGKPATPQAALDIAVQALREHGYEPRREGDRTVMANCPFHALAQVHPTLVCHMNHALITGLIGSLAPDRVDAKLDPGDDRCCVTLVLPRE
ncbi:MAG TPA: helix-turn-helix domain-containing protein [Thermopolyspora sp.]